jgi:predicted esterase
LTPQDGREKVQVVSRLKVQFAHGLASSPYGNKARLFAEHFDALTPVMNTGDLESCVKVHEEALATFRPDVLIGSSFGGAVVMRLLERGAWKGPTLLLAQAARHYLPACRIPEGVRVLLVHAPEDEVVDIAGSRALAKTGTPGRVELIEVDDDHALAKITASGELLRFVRRAADVLET